MNKFRKIMIIFMFVLFAAHGPFGGFCAQTLVSVCSYVGLCVGSIFDSAIRDDMYSISYNLFNQNEAKVVQSEKVSFYKGVPIFRTQENLRSGSFCAVLLSKDSVEMDIKHEYGHNIQQLILGPVTFLTMIGAPSFFQWSNREYYDRPWEITADLFGGVDTRLHSEHDIRKGRAYIAVSAMYGPFGYLFLPGEF